jgi:hypothetical protein
VNSYKNDYSFCLVGGSGDKGGGIYYLNDKIEFFEDGSNYFFNAAIEGGVYYCYSCNISVNNANYTYNIASIGGIVFLTGFIPYKIEFKNTIM